VTRLPFELQPRLSHCNTSKTARSPKKTPADAIIQGFTVPDSHIFQKGAAGTHPLPG